MASNGAVDIYNDMLRTMEVKSLVLQSFINSYSFRFNYFQVEWCVCFNKLRRFVRRIAFLRSELSA